MISCPELTLQPVLYDTVLPWLSIIALILNPYVIYCIIWRSTAQMKIYRWFLLYHQVMIFACDIMVSYLVQPVLLLPFPIGYPIGYLHGILPTKVVMNLGLFTACLGIGSVLHLFGYRYEIVSGTKRLFPPYVIATMIFGYGGCFIIPTAIFVADLQYPEVSEMLRNTYTCARDEIFAIEGIMIYKYVPTVIYGVIPLTFLTIFFISTDLIILYLSYKATNTLVMSQKLKKVQRRFLLQVTLQSFIPLVLISAPILAAIFAFCFEIFGTAWLADLIFVVLSAFGSIGGSVLIAMNPTYYNWIYKFKTIQIAPISSIIPKR